MNIISELKKIQTIPINTANAIIPNMYGIGLVSLKAVSEVVKISDAITNSFKYLGRIGNQILKVIPN